jgi:hypothetical protein
MRGRKGRQRWVWRSVRATASILQSLHRHGGKLRGQVGTGFGHGLAGIADGRYRFSVRFALPLPGEVLPYGGLLDAVAPSSPAT